MEKCDRFGQISISTKITNNTIIAIALFVADGKLRCSVQRCYAIALVKCLFYGNYEQHNIAIAVFLADGKDYRGMPHRNCILMNPDDAEKAGFGEHQRMTVQGDGGKLENVEIIFGDTRQGAAMMFYPEVNVIFKAKIDMRSRTPAYKRVPVFVFA